MGTSWQATPLTGSIAPGGSYLVAQAAGSGGSLALPTPDAAGTLGLSGTAGKVALSTSATAFACGVACAGTTTRTPTSTRPTP